MNDKQIIDTLKNIKKYCHHRNCDEGCLFRIQNGLYACQFDALRSVLNTDPWEWDIEELERIIKQ